MKSGAQILIYHGKHNDEYWLVDTPERMEAAQRKLFKMLDEWGCYEEGEDHLIEARSGNVKAIHWILSIHQQYEYEGWDIEEAFDPLCE
jgi:hypothetical protein